jgi:hypothetical protein
LTYNGDLCDDFYYADSLPVAIDIITDCVAIVYQTFESMTFDEILNELNWMQGEDYVEKFNQIKELLDESLSNKRKSMKRRFGRRTRNFVMCSSSDVDYNSEKSLYRYVNKFKRLFFLEKLNANNNNTFLGYLYNELPCNSVARIIRELSLLDMEMGTECAIYLLGICFALFEKIINCREHKGSNTRFLKSAQYRKVAKSNLASNRQTMIDFVSDNILNGRFLFLLKTLDNRMYLGYCRENTNNMKSQLMKLYIPSHVIEMKYEGQQFDKIQALYNQNRVKELEDKILEIEIQQASVCERMTEQGILRQIEPNEDLKLRLKRQNAGIRPQPLNKPLFVRDSDRERLEDDYNHLEINRVIKMNQLNRIRRIDEICAPVFLDELTQIAKSQNDKILNRNVIEKDDNNLNCATELLKHATLKISDKVVNENGPSILERVEKKENTIEDKIDPDINSIKYMKQKLLKKRSLSENSGKGIEKFIEVKALGSTWHQGGSMTRQKRKILPRFKRRVMLVKKDDNNMKFLLTGKVETNLQESGFRRTDKYMKLINNSTCNYTAKRADLKAYLGTIVSKLKDNTHKLEYRYKPG